jgi:hypothetical protein
LNFETDIKEDGTANHDGGLCPPSFVLALLSLVLRAEPADSFRHARKLGGQLSLLLEILDELTESVDL